MELIKIGKTFINLDHVVSFRFEEGHFFIQIVGMSLQKIEGPKEKLEELFDYLDDCNDDFDDLKLTKA